MRIAPLAAVFGAALFLAGHAALAGDERPGDAKHGKQLFAEHCALCHGPSAEGAVGPSLKAELKRKTPDQIRAQIMNPQPPMAKLYPSVISEKDVDDLVAFVVTL
ncbi:MAG TPA: cytochrome c [Candidatus Elarobacter sp.]|jgi:mono/diheme cytochrome c family protein